MISARYCRMLAYGAFLAASTSASSIAFAQAGPLNPPPVRSPVDGNGVNLATGGIQVSTTDVMIGSPGSGGLAHTRTWVGNGWVHGFFIVLQGTSPNSLLITIGAHSTSVTTSDGYNYTSDQGDGSTFSWDPSGLSGTYIGSDGTKVTFEASAEDYYNNVYDAVGTSITTPSGEKTILTYGYYDCYPIICRGRRLLSVNNSSGYQLKYSYGSSGYSGLVISKVTAINSGVDYCDPSSVSCSGLTQNWPSASYPYGPNCAGVNYNTQESVADSLGRVTRYTISPVKCRLIGIKRPSSGTDNITIGYDANGRVSSISNGSATWNYAWSLSGTTLTATSTDPLSHQRVTTADTGNIVILTDKDALNRTSTYQYDSKGRLIYVVPPEGTISAGVPTAGYSQYGYDARGNLTTTTRVSKTPGTPSDIVTSSTYPSSCANIFTCNKPISSTDARGNVTDYTYDSATGFLTSVSLPASTAGAVRPQTRYSYSSLYAYYRQTSGGMPVQAITPIVKLTGTSTCVTTSSCSGNADEIKTIIGFGPQVSGTMNNLLPTSVSNGAGNGSLTATITSVYDMTGNLYTVDGPLPGSDDTTRYRYDAAHQLIGVVSPDPDGGGALKNRALRYSYNLDGQPTLVEAGTVNSQSDPDWSSFARLQQVEMTYDSIGRKITDDLSDGTTVISLSQYSYDAANRTDCVAQRLNPSIYGSLPSSACTLGTAGTFGPDRISKNDYDAANQLTSITTGYGSAVQRVDQTMTYTANGLLDFIKDGKNNTFKRIYDPFDRFMKLSYPSPTTPGVASDTDYEQLTYDAASNVTSRRLRDGSSIAFTYDNLNRLVSKTPQGENVVNFGYDLLGRMTSANRSGDGITHSFTYDALSRLTSEGQSFGSMAYDYDLAGRRVRQTWQDGFHVTYGYLLTGEMTTITEKGGSPGAVELATFGYDDLGRRLSLGRGNGTVTSYCYQASPGAGCASNGFYLTSLSQDLANTANDQVQTFSYNPAGQLTGQTRSNDAYAFRQIYNANRNYGVNGLNQYTGAGSFTPGYDARGNMTSMAGGTYTYWRENRLKSAPGGVTLYYDALDRLNEYDTSTSTRFAYDGNNVAEEVANPSGAVTRRYVYGPGVDEPLVWYEGSGTSDKRWLHADERGSITVASNSSGNPVDNVINSYDEYGMPATGNIGLFQYTGQMWLEGTGIAPNGLYHYKARAYSPRLGRFLQTDPIGFAGGMNLYNYAGSDPINRIDPNGTDDWDITPIIVTARPSSGFSFSSIGLNFNIYDLIGGYPAVSTTGADGKIVVTALHNCNYYYVCSYRVNAFTSAILGGDSGDGIFSHFPTFLASAVATPAGSDCGRASALGKVWSGPNSALGLLYGGAGAAVSSAAYGLGLTSKAPGVGIGHNAIEFSNNLFASAGAVTLGNVSVYGTTPNAPLRGVSQGWQHEIQHTGQGEVLGLSYLPAIAASWATGLLMDGDIHGPHSFLESGSGTIPAIPWGC